MWVVTQYDSAGTVQFLFKKQAYFAADMHMQMNVLTSVI